MVIINLKDIHICYVVRENKLKLVKKSNYKNGA